MKHILEIKNLTKYYGKTIGVKDLSLKLETGEIFGFIGPNGAGKSTTIRSIMNLINKTSGNIYINGKEINKYDIELKRIIGYLPSEINLYDDMTVKEIIAFHTSFYNKDFSKRKRELVELLKLDESKKIEELSYGNLKKLGILLALVHKPKILILDEPTSGLDPLMQQVFFDILKQEKEEGTTIFYSTHILSEITKICDRVGIIKDGKLINVETVKELENRSLTEVTIKSKDVVKIKKQLDLEIIEESDEYIKFKNNLDANILIKKLSKYDIKELLIESSTLESVLMNYY